MTEKDKPEGWEDTVGDLIRARFNYENTNAALKKKFGEIGAIGGDVYRDIKAKITGGDKVDEKLDDLGERKRVHKKKASPQWSKGKQTAADTSMLAKIVNAGIYQAMMPMCENKELKEEDVQEINPGGALVANINYYFPEQKLDHPLVLLGIRCVILYVKFKAICTTITQIPRNPKSNVNPKQGIKPGMKTEMRV